MLEDTLDGDFEHQALAFQPWLPKSPAELALQQDIQQLLARKSGARFGRNCYVAPSARIFTQAFSLGDGSWVAAGAIIRGNVRIAADCSVNPYAHIAGDVELGRGCRIAGHVSIYGFNHGFDRTDIMIKDQPITSLGVKIQEDVWIGANAVILDGVEIGAHCVVAAGAVVTQSFAPYQIIGGNPARAIRDRRHAASPSQADAASTHRDPKSATPEPKVADASSPLPVRKLFFEIDPYHHLEQTYPEDLQGWGSYEPVFLKCIQSLRPRLIVEVGTWKGASALHMAKLCRELSLETEIVCVDTWLGNWQHWSRKDGVGSRSDLRLRNGFPQLYFQFLSNVVAKGMTDIITPLPLTGIAAAKLFAHYGLQPDLVYVDGDHEYESVIMDLRSWLSVLASNGILIGDDYSWPGVRRAATEIAAEGTWNLEVQENKFLLKAVVAKH